MVESTDTVKLENGQYKKGTDLFLLDFTDKSSRIQDLYTVVVLEVPQCGSRDRM